MRVARLLIVLPLLSASTPAGATIEFRSRVEFSVGGSPAAFALLEVSPATLVVAGDGGIRLFRWDEHGWQAGRQIVDRPYVRSLAVADVDADGRPDVLYANGSEPELFVLLAEGRDRFAAAMSVPTDFVPTQVLGRSLPGGAGDAVFLLGTSGTAVLRRDGEGFRAAPLLSLRLPLVADVQGIDWNGDAIPDLVIASSSDRRLQVLEGDAENRFRVVAEAETIGEPQAVAVADVDGDRRPDVLALTDRGLTLHRHKGGGLGAAALVWAEPHLGGMAVGDVDADGRPDLAVANRSRGTLTFFRGLSRGDFVQAQSYDVGRAPSAVLLTDFDHDDLIDGLVLNELSDSVTVLHGRGQGRFDSSPCILGDAEDFDAVAAADFDDDDNLDLAVTSRDGGTISVFLGDGYGHFRRRPLFRVGRQPRGVVAADFDVDGKPDIATVNFGGDDVSILTGDGRGTFHAPILISVGLGPVAIASGPFSGADRVDLAVANALSRSVSVLYGDGRGRFPDVVNFALESTPSFLFAADVDGDGHDDLVVGSERDESVAILRGDGRRLAAPEIRSLGTVARPSIAEDFDGDGLLDLVVLRAADDTMEILPGTGIGEFGAPLVFPVGRDPHAATSGDFDGDGRIDLAIVHGAARTISILLNRTETAPRRHLTCSHLDRRRTPF